MLSPSLPQKPGVYWFLDSAAKVLYVGKAKRLKTRLSAYRLSPTLHVKTRKLLSLAAHTRFLITPNENTALLLEAQLIQAYQPTYNSRLKDDRSPIYILITQESYPRVLIRRQHQLSQLPTLTIFGPFDSAKHTRQLLNIARRIIPFCTQGNSGSDRPCFYYHLSLCPGACCRRISPAAYRHYINRVIRFFRSDFHHLRLSYRRSINYYSRRRQFEQAGRLKLRLDLLNRWLISRPGSAIDPLPDLTSDLVSHQLTSLGLLLHRHIGLPLSYPLSRIEGYDISDLGGKHASASLVVFTHGRPDKSQYRRFNIRSLNTPNDPGMLHQALSRRASHSEWPRPNLILIDGGKAQLRAAIRAIPWNIPIISLVKNPDRLLLPRLPQRTHISSVKLAPSRPYARLVTAVRDESHRFARSGFRSRYRRALLDS